MSRILSTKAKRLIPVSEIEWLTHEDRAKHRATLKFFANIIELLDDDKRLTEAQEGFMQNFTGSGEPETWMKAAIQALEKSEEAYFGKLARQGQHDLTAYHEFMNPDQPPAAHQIWLCDKLMQIESGALKTLLVSLSPGAAKALALDTPIPTPTGWTTMGALRVGDTVFDENGKPCNVTWVSPVWKNRPVYEVTTDCGDTIIADELHEWPICSDRSTGEYENTETRHIRPRYGKKPRIQRAKALILPDAALPIDPYLLGVWLGDGTSSSLSITSSVEDQPWLRAELASLGYKTKTRDTVPTLFHVYGVRAKFVALGLINDPAHSTFGRKHVPEIYMRASPSQRLSLLQGLMDTDGTVCKRSGAATFCNTNKELALSVRELARSLGVKAGWSEGRAILNGVDHGPVYRVCVYHAEAMRMPRKRALCKAGTRTPNTYIDVEPAGFADTICITVDSPSHLFLAGRAMTPTHNSSYGSRSFIQWVMGRNPDWPILAAGHSQMFTNNEFSKPNRDAINSDLYRAVFPDIFLSENDKSADYWKLDGFNGKYYAKGAGAGIAGIRATLTDIDDPIRTAEDASSAVIREKLWRWMTADVLARRLPNARLVLIMTRWHSEDMAGMIERIYKDKPEAIAGPVEILNIPAQAGPDDPVGRKEGEWLWEDFYGAAHYESLRATMPPGMWSALYMGQPLDKFGEYIAEEQFMRYDQAPSESSKIRKTVISVDTAQKATERSNPTAITVYRQGTDGIHYMLYGQKVKAKMDEVVKLLSRLATNYNANYILIEDAGFGSQILQNYQGKLPCPLKEFAAASKSSKDFMFENAVTYITSGLIRFPRMAPWLADFVNELVAFPSGTEDDYVDSFSQYVAHAIRSYRTGTRPLKVVG